MVTMDGRYVHRYDDEWMNIPQYRLNHVIFFLFVSFESSILYYAWWLENSFCTHQSILLFYFILSKTGYKFFFHFCIIKTLNGNLSHIIDLFYLIDFWFFVVCVWIIFFYIFITNDNDDTIISLNFSLKYDYEEKFKLQISNDSIQSKSNSIDRCVWSWWWWSISHFLMKKKKKIICI